jgi:hypothetical protein
LAKSLNFNSFISTQRKEKSTQRKEKVLRDGQDLSGTKIALNVDAILKHDISLSFHFINSFITKML